MNLERIYTARFYVGDVAGCFRVQTFGSVLLIAVKVIDIAAKRYGLCKLDRVVLSSDSEEV